MVFSGYEAEAIRKLLLGRSGEKRIAVARRNISRMFEGAEVEAVSLNDLDDLYRPVEVMYRVNWPGYGTLADDRMIIRPFVFRTKPSSPFTASERHNDMFFPFQRMESDNITLTLPDGYELEVKEAPPSLPGQTLSYKVRLGFDKQHNSIVGTRDFSFGALYVPVSGYPQLKQWFDAVTEADQHALVLRRIAVEKAAAPVSQ